jgi:ABC-2 type transport system permease protein
MKVIDIAFKDLSQSFRSLFALAFMFGVPILMTGIFYFMFGGSGGDDEEAFNMSKTTVYVVNLDLGSDLFSSDFIEGNFDQFNQTGIEVSDISSMGDMLVQILNSDSFSEIIEVIVVNDVAVARTAVDDQRAGVAIIIPEGFSAALMETDQTATLELYQDPTLTIGPSIVKSFLSQFVDNVIGANVGIGVVFEQLSESGVVVDQGKAQEIIIQFLSTSSEGEQGGRFGSDQLLDIRSPTGEETTQGSDVIRVVSMIMAGMMVFYAFFTGAATAQNIIREEEAGTLQRLFTTPTPISTIFAGKFIAIFLTVIVQVSVLMIFSNLVFGIVWGDLISVLLVAIGMVIAASTLGIFLVSFLKDSRQAGIVFGGVMTVMGMIGIINVFTMGVPNKPQILETASLLVPQGWAMRGLQMTMEGSALADILLFIGGLAIWSVIFFIIGNQKLRKRYG